MGVILHPTTAAPTGAAIAQRADLLDLGVACPVATGWGGIFSTPAAPRRKPHATPHAQSRTGRRARLPRGAPRPRLGQPPKTAWRPKRFRRAGPRSASTSLQR